jgi:lysozyme family protein
VPWFVIAVIHERECSQSWSRSIAQGDPWDKKSTHVPAGRGPFKSWENAAVDALVNCAPYAARNKDWSIGGILTLLEQYNGLGYASKGLPSPYVWSGTDIYVAGQVCRRSRL